MEVQVASSRVSSLLLKAWLCRLGVPEHTESELLQVIVQEIAGQGCKTAHLT